MYIKLYDRSLPRITFFVLAIHFVLILWVIFSPYSIEKRPKVKERLVVKTIPLNPVQKPKVAPVKSLETPSLPVSTEPAPSIDTPVQKQEPLPNPIEPLSPPLKNSEPIESNPEPVKKIEKEKSKPQSTKKPVEQKQSAKKKPEPTKKETAKKPAAKKETSAQSKKTEPAQKPKTEKPKKNTQADPAKVKAQQAAEEKQRKLLAAAQESIAKIDQGRVKMGAAKSNLNAVTSTPLAISSLSIDTISENQGTILTPGETSYRDELASRLKLMLKLPEHGDVQLKLTLDRTGKVTKVNIVKSASSANRSYIEKTLPNLKFPAFGNDFKNMSEYTFIIQLSNEL